MIFLKFSQVHICVFLILMFYAVFAASKNCHPMGMKGITRVGKRLEYDVNPSSINPDSKRSKHLTNFIRTGRVVKPCNEDGIEPWYENEAGDLKLVNDGREPPYAVLNYGTPASWQLMGLNTYSMDELD